MLDTKSSLDLIRPDWPAPANIQAFTTTRSGGFSRGRWSSFNLGNNCGDDPVHVKQNRGLLRMLLPSTSHWLRQVHGNNVASWDEGFNYEPEADAIVSHNAGQACTVMTADCLPVLFCDKTGTKVAAAHAGWRGLAAGILENTISAMVCDPDDLMVWLGPAIGPRAFEVGRDVYDVFLNLNTDNSTAFIPFGERWLADLYELARLALSNAGINKISGGQYCTYTNKREFFSYRRDGQTGRMVTVIWLED